MHYYSSSARTKWHTLFMGLAALALTAGSAIAKDPLPLDRITVPDVNRLGMLDCTGAGMGNNCGGYQGFPITKPGKQDQLIALGKALFWDMQAGSDGVQACASCHFQAGADHRVINQKNPGLNRVSGTQAKIKKAINPDQLTPNPDTDFTGGGANYHLQPGDFPFEVKTGAGAKPNFGQNDVSSSQGVRGGKFTSLAAALWQRVESGDYLNQDPNGFNLNGTQTVRRVPPRNTPSAHAAIYNLRNFWDGRANVFFNGVNPFGMLDPNARVKVAAQDGSYTLSDLQLMIPFSSAASQAVGPPGSPFEMDLEGRPFDKLGEKFTAFGFIPLDRQKIDPNDSVLGPYRNPTTGRGFDPNNPNANYVALIEDIFQEKFWKTSDNVLDTSLIQTNFALFWGLAVQAYEATLIPDQTPVDQILHARSQGGNSNLGLPNQDLIEKGLNIFLSGKGDCSTCHVGSEFSSATVSHLTGFGDPDASAPAGVQSPSVALSERMTMGDGMRAVYDSGWYNIGVRPTADDLSNFNRTGDNVPFSFTMLAHEILANVNDPTITAVNQLLQSGTLLLPKSPNDLSGIPFNLTVACAPPSRGGQAFGIVNGMGCTPMTAVERVAVRGAFKVPGLRNVKFTGPYFHNGSKKNVREVLNLYNVGGHFNKKFNPDRCLSNSSTCVIGQVDFDADIQPIGFNEDEMAALVAFLEDGLTDSRVAQNKAPFDHPQLCVPHGHDPNGVIPAGVTIGDTSVLKNLPAVGAGGYNADMLTFEQMLSDASGPHDLKDPCDMTPQPNVN